MSAPELADMLFKQEYMKNTVQEQAMTEAEIIQQRLEQITLQQKLEKATERVSELFANFVAGPVGDFLTSMNGIYTILGLMAVSAIPSIINGFKTLGSVLKFVKIQQIGTAIAAGWTAAMSSPESFITGGLAGLLAGGLITAAIMSSLNDADDLFSAGQGSSGYGKRVLLAPEGAFALNDRDNIIATTNPVRANDLMSTGAGNITVAPAALPPVYTRIELNGSAIGNATSRDNYGMGKNIYAFGGRVDYSA